MHPIRTIKPLEPRFLIRVRSPVMRALSALQWGIMCLMLWPCVLQAQSTGEALYDVFSLTSEASVEVDNDLMVAILSVEEQDNDASALADRINATMSWANNVLRPYVTITVKTRDYQTYPRYDKSAKRRIIGWTARQSIELETDDFATAAKAIQALQERLVVQGINLSVKPETRQKASDVLIDNALNAFKERARLIQRNMNSSGFRVLEVNIQTDNGSGMYMQPRMASMQASESLSNAPSIAAGTTRVVVSVSGRIQLD